MSRRGRRRASSVRRLTTDALEAVPPPPSTRSGPRAGATDQDRIGRPPPSPSASGRRGRRRRARLSYDLDLEARHGEPKAAPQPRRALEPDSAAVGLDDL